MCLQKLGLRSYNPPLLPPPLAVVSRSPNQTAYKKEKKNKEEKKRKIQIVPHNLLNNLHN